MAKMLEKEWPVCCAVCRRQAHGSGYTPRFGAPIAWLCDDPTCLKLGRVVYHMGTKDYTLHEAASLSEAGSDAGEYLESIGKTDLASLTAEEWNKFLSIILDHYGRHMRKRLLSHEAPF